MPQRLDYKKLSPNGYKKMIDWYLEVKKSAVDPIIQHLILVRVSQINQCAYCIDVHTKEARHAGESEQRLYALSAWQESPHFSEKEKAALDWAEVVTSINKGPVKDEIFEKTRQFFSDQEIVDLTLLIASINALNRIGVSFKAQ